MTLTIITNNQPRDLISGYELTDKERATLLEQTLSNPYTLASFRALDRHATRGPLDRDAALRLLRNNVRDTDRQASHETQQRVAIALLTHWATRRNAASQTQAE